MSRLYQKRNTVLFKLIIFTMILGFGISATVWAAPPVPKYPDQNDQDQSPQDRKKPDQRKGAKRPDYQKSSPKRKGSQTSSPKANTSSQRNKPRTVVRKPTNKKVTTPKNRGRYPKTGKIYTKITGDHYTVRSHSRDYIFHQGIFYSRDPRGYKVVKPPRGAVVRHLPSGFETLIIAGITYFIFANVFYNKTASGYVVVDEPAGFSHGVAIPQDGQALAVNTRLLNVRSGPGLGHPVIFQVRLSEVLIFQGYSGSWYYVQLPNGNYGWVMSKYTRVIFTAADG